jgi:hypothetical protein
MNHIGNERTPTRFAFLSSLVEEAIILRSTLKKHARVSAF